jgi:F-type H+-transporting ATPase subunit gamma
MSSQQDIQGRISSVQNIHKITRAMEMVAAARLRKAEERIEKFRRYAEGIRRMTRKAVDAAGKMPDLPLLEEHERVERVGLYLVSSDRGLAGPFNSQLIRAGTRREREIRDEGPEIAWYVSGKKGVSSLTFRGYELWGEYTGFTDRPSYPDAREIAQDLIAAYTDGKLDRVEMFYNRYHGPMQQEVTREVLLPLQQAEMLGDGEDDEEEQEGEEPVAGGPDAEGAPIDHSRSLWIYEPDPESILERLAPDYVEVSIFRALLESTASEHGARMSAMRHASENAEEMIDDLQMEANRARQAEITQQLMEIMAGAEALG